tara:strand:- start:2305 stop:3633 length:1329 start_codon:yes stop_codon:yes gene_type:complete
MSSNVNGRTHYLEIQPSNVKSNGKVSYRDGNPVIEFIIGEQNTYLLGQTLRLAGNIQVYKTDDTYATSADNINVSPKLGMLGAIDQIVLSSQRNKSVIEHIRHFGRWASSYYGNVASKGETLTHLNETTGMMANPLAQKISFTANQNGASQTSAEYDGNSFCVPLTTGLLSSSDPVPLSAQWGIGGLNLAIHLTPDSQFLFAPTLGNAYYELSNLKLICEVVEPAVDELSRLMSQSSGAMSYNAITSYYTSINSTFATINFNLALSNVLSVFLNFIPSNYLNNLAYDGFQTTPLMNGATEVAPITQMVITRGGQKIGFEYNLDANVRDNASSTIADPQLVRFYMNAFNKFMDSKKSQLSPHTTFRKLNSTSANTHYPEGGQYFGLGIAFDNVSGDGVAFQSGNNFGVNLETGLTNDNPHATFIFVRSKQTLAFTPNGLQVVS